jgi:hypothetical protein
MARDVMFLFIVRLKFAEYLRGRYELIRLKLLIADDKHMMADKSAVQ